MTESELYQERKQKAKAINKNELLSIIYDYIKTTPNQSIYHYFKLLKKEKYPTITYGSVIRIVDMLINTGKIIFTMEKSTKNNMPKKLLQIK